MEDFRRMIIKVSDVEGASATIPVSNDHTDGSWLITDIYEGELFLNLIDNILQTRTDAGIINLNASSSSDADRVVQDVRYDEGVEKGEPLIITGYNVGSGIITVAKADASVSAEMPSYGLAMANYSSGATGQMIAVGTLTDVNTSSFSEGDKVYVAVGGGLTNVKPIEPNLIQNVGFVARSNPNNGSIEVVAIGRANDVPNLPVGHTFIGTSTNPTTIDLTTALDSKVDGTGTTNYVSKWTGATTQGDSLIFDDGTSVGIGTNSPNSIFKLDVNGKIVVRDEIYVNSALIYFGSNDFNIQSTNSIILKPSNTEAMRILANGNVGIGTTAPSARLHVIDTVEPLRFGYSASQYGSISTTSGGDLEFSCTGNEIDFHRNATQLVYLDVNQSGTNHANFRMWNGYNVVNYLTTSGNSYLNGGNVGIGTTNPTEALDVVGKIALNDGGNSVFIGVSAGLNDDGSNNDNVGIGLNSLRNNTTGYFNTAIGAYSLDSNTTGANNTATGRQSLTSNTTGLQNTANGYQSLRFNTTGANNTANGYQSLLNNTGWNNTGNGYLSLLNNTSGNNNIANGGNSGRFISDGVTANTITNNSLYLGYNTKALANNQTNQIVIGYDATGNGSNSVVLGNDSITKTTLRGNVSTDGSVQVGDNTDTAIASNVGAMRYRTDGSASYADMCMEVAPSTYEWVNIVTNTF